MSIVAFDREVLLGIQAGKTHSSRQASLLRILLLIGCAVSVLVAARLGDPTTYLAADPELAQLLRGIALIKAAIVAAAISVVLWRFGRPISALTAGVYLTGLWMLAGASMLIWQLTLIPFAAVSFHVAEFALLVAVLREHRSESGLLARWPSAPGRS